MSDQVERVLRTGGWICDDKRGRSVRGSARWIYRGGIQLRRANEMEGGNCSRKGKEQIEGAPHASRIEAGNGGERWSGYYAGRGISAGRSGDLRQMQLMKFGIK